jgi:ATP-binding cassette subfamily F protein 3
LALFLFCGEDVDKTVSTLSGGERARLILAKLMLKKVNLLILDEPTNHLDIDSKEVFEEALSDYPGTVIAVSHDRYFLNRVATRIFELERTGITEYVGGYDYYEEKKAQISSAKKYAAELSGTGTKPSADTSVVSAGGGSAALHAGGASRDGYASASQGGAAGGTFSREEALIADLHRAQNAAGLAGTDEAGRPLSAAEERALKKKKQTEEKRLARQKARLEEEITALEEEIETMQQEMCKPEVLADPIRLTELDEEVKATQEELEHVYEEWMELEG